MATVKEQAQAAYQRALSDPSSGMSINKTATTTSGTTANQGATTTATSSANATPAYGSNIANFDSSNANHVALADAGQQWAAAKASGDTAGMQAAAQLGQQIRDSMGNASFNSQKGVTTVGGNMQQGGGLNDIFDSYKKQTDGIIQSGTASINQTRDNQLAEYARTLNEAIANGQITIRDAQDAYAKQAQVINQQNYQQAQVTNLAGEDRGIGNSQQMLGMMASDNSRTNTLINQNMTDRDRKIFDVQNKLNQIKNDYGINVANSNANAGYEVAQLTGNANAAMYGNIANMQGQNYFNNQQQQYTQQNMATQQGYTQQNMATQQGYTQSNMGLQQQYALQQMGQAFKNDLKKMEIGQGYDMQKLSASFANQLKAMAVQNSYDNAKLEKQIAADQAKYNQAIQREQAEYETARARELAKYTPGSVEYQIKDAQMKDAHEQAVSELHTKALYEAQVTQIMDTAKQYGYKAPVKKDNMSVAEQNAYNQQMEAYQRYQSLINGTSNPNNLMGSTGNSSLYYTPSSGATGNLTEAQRKSIVDAGNWNLFGNLFGF